MNKKQGWVVTVALLLAASPAFWSPASSPVLWSPVWAQGLPGADNKGRWMTKASVPTERTEASVADLDGKLYLIGGYVLGSVTSNLLQSCDPITKSWSERARQPTPRSGASAAVLDGLIVVIGGEGSSQAGVYGENEAYDPKTDTWRTLAPMTVPRHGTGAAVIDGVFYMPGGATGRGGGPRVATHEAFTLR